MPSSFWPVPKVINLDFCKSTIRSLIGKYASIATTANEKTELLWIFAYNSILDAHDKNLSPIPRSILRDRDNISPKRRKEALEKFGHKPNQWPGSNLFHRTEELFM